MSNQQVRKVLDYDLRWAECSPLDLFLYLSDQQRLPSCPGLRLGAGVTGRRPVGLGAAPAQQGAHTLRPHVQDGV